MNKQEAIEKATEIMKQLRMGGTIWVNKDDVIDIISKIDEPQKVVVPKFVAEWIEKEKEKKNKSRLSHALGRVFNDSNELSLYIKQQEGDYTETIAKAWYDGYTVEKEKLYTVEIPNPNSAGGKLVLFKQQSTGLLILDMLNPNINKPKYLQLTESEIKEDFDFLWQFAKEAE